MRHFLLFAMLSAFVAPAPAADPVPKPSQTGYAVLIGVGQYDDKAISPRPSADADAKAMYDLVADPNVIGIPTDRIALLTGTADDKRHGRQASKDNILRAIHEAVEKTGKGDLLVIGFFGRAAPLGADKIAFFARESTFAERAKTAITAQELSDEMKKVKQQRLCVLTDLSFKGIDPGKETVAEPNAGVLLAAFYGTISESKDKDEDDEPATQIRDKVVALAQLPGNDPITVGENGLFAKTVVAGLKGAADTDGYEADGVVTVDELAKYLDKVVVEQARTLGKNTSEKEAVPVVVGLSTAHFAVSTSPAYPAAVKRREAFQALVKGNVVNKDEADEGAKYLDWMPKFKTPQELRKKYQALADGKLAIDAFRADRAKLLDEMKASDATVRKFVDVMLAGEETITTRYVKPVDAGTLTAGTIKGLFRRLDEPLPAELEAKLKEPKNLSDTQQKELLAEARRLLGKREDLDDGKDLDLALVMMAASLEDPHTVYVDKETLKKEESKWRSQYSGIGIHIRRDLARDGLLVVSPILGSPAYKAGIRAGDLITEVRREVDPDGNPLTSDQPKVVSLRGMKTDKAIELILGKPDTPITVVIERQGVAEPIVQPLVRGRVSLETVLGVQRDDKDNWKFYLDAENKIGYIYLTQFGPQTFQQLQGVVEKLTKDGMKGLVLDLRYNPGGVLTGAIAISDLFLESGLLLKIKPRVGQEQRYYDQGKANMNFNRQKFPMAVLINGGSASASEIVSQTLQDYDRAVVVGERSYGKGSVQTVDGFDPTDGVFKMTTARYFPPMGRNIDRRSTSGKETDEWGVMPTKGYEVKLTPEERLDLGEWLLDKEHIQHKNAPAVKKAKGPFKDKQLDAAMDYLRKEVAAKAGTARNG